MICSTGTSWGSCVCFVLGNSLWICLMALWAAAVSCGRTLEFHSWTLLHTLQFAFARHLSISLDSHCFYWKRCWKISLIHFIHDLSYSLDTRCSWFCVSMSHFFSVIYTMAWRNLVFFCCVRKYPNKRKHEDAVRSSLAFACPTGNLSLEPLLEINLGMTPQSFIFMSKPALFCSTPAFYILEILLSCI